MGHIFWQLGSQLYVTIKMLNPKGKEKKKKQALIPEEKGIYAAQLKQYLSKTSVIVHLTVSMIVITKVKGKDTDWGKRS